MNRYNPITNSRGMNACFRDRIGIEMHDGSKIEVQICNGRILSVDPEKFDIKEIMELCQGTLKYGIFTINKGLNIFYRILGWYIETREGDIWPFQPPMENEHNPYLTLYEDWTKD